MPPICMKCRVRTYICAALNESWIHRDRMGIIFLRVCVSILMLGHGLPKLWLLLNGGGSEWLDPLGIGGSLSLALCAFAEVFCSLFLIVGLFSRFSAMVLLINFWVVVFVVHAQGSWAQAELPLLYLICYGTLVCTGAGPFSLDSLMKRRLHCRYSEAPHGIPGYGVNEAARASSAK